MDCTWGAWGVWNKCSKTCGNGIRSRVRPKNVKEDHGGICPGQPVESGSCKLKDCGKLFPPLNKNDCRM